jgi:hypothetical protein
VTRLLRAGAPAADILFARSAGEVLAVFSRAVYVVFPRGILVLTVPAAEPGPLHIQVTALPRVSVGDPAVSGGGELTVAGVRLRGPARIWRPPPLPDPARVATTLRAVLRHRPDLDLAGGAGAADQPRLSATLRRRGLSVAAANLAGRGAGLTPAGDDVLAGLLLVARAADPGAEASLVGLARTVRTHAISRAFLEQAARGRSVASLHALVAACAESDADAARGARRRLAGLGATSGLDLAYGVLVGAANHATAPWPAPAAATAAREA